MPKVVSVNISERKGEIKLPIDKGLLVENLGLFGDAHAEPGDRQISLLAEESIAKMAPLVGITLNPGSFAENITTRGLALHVLPIGTKLVIGECVLEISKIGKECHTGCEVFKQTGACIMPKEGVFARVLKGGYIAAGFELSSR